MNIPRRLRSIGSSAFRLASALTLAAIAIGAIGLAANWAYTYPEREQAKRAEVMHEWSADLSGNLGMKLRAKTKVIDGAMQMALDFDGHPEFLNHPANQKLGFQLEWVDADGFTRVKKSVDVSEFTTVVNDKGTPRGIHGQFSTFVSVADYNALAAMKVGWNVKTEIPQTAAAAPPPATSAPKADHCEPGISRQERLRRLAQHGQVRETGSGEYTAGERSVNFMPTDGSLLACR